MFFQFLRHISWIYLEFRENLAKLIRIWAKIHHFIVAKFREIQNNFVKVSCFSKFWKLCFAATLGEGRGETGDYIFKYVSVT